MGLHLVLSQRDDSIRAGTPGGCHFTKSFYQVIFFSPSHFPFAKSFYEAILETHNDRSDTGSLASGISTDTSTTKTPHNCCLHFSPHSPRRFSSAAVLLWYRPLRRSTWRLGRRSCDRRHGRLLRHIDKRDRALPLVNILLAAEAVAECTARLRRTNANVSSPFSGRVQHYRVFAASGSLGGGHRSAPARTSPAWA